ncbi:hypothetical protein [Indioceanicola profundi]|uniref:hypothetical protein n=1 Tax=Indioceanicola profundi TaxID=2220096 RepID=UPI000E6AD11D|nr:hypothetical protein [Indioceanicola profundi]
MRDVAIVNLMSMLLLSACSTADTLPRAADSSCPSGERYVRPHLSGTGIGGSPLSIGRDLCEPPQARTSRDQH